MHDTAGAEVMHVADGEEHVLAGIAVQEGPGDVLSGRARRDEFETGDDEDAARWNGEGRARTVGANDGIEQLAAAGKRAGGGGRDDRDDVARPLRRYCRRRFECDDSDQAGWNRPASHSQVPQARNATHAIESSSIVLLAEPDVLVAAVIANRVRGRASASGREHPLSALGDRGRLLPKPVDP